MAAGCLFVQGPNKGTDACKFDDDPGYLSCKVRFLFFLVHHAFGHTRLGSNPPRPTDLPNFSFAQNLFGSISSALFPCTNPRSIGDISILR